MKHEISLFSNNGEVKYDGGRVNFTAASDKADTYFSLSVRLGGWEKDAYIFMPACAYDGNKFKKSYVKYPPTYSESECGIFPEPIISDVPSLNPDGSSEIEVTTGDLSTPCVGIFYPEKKQALFVFCEQECKGKNIGLRVSSGEITLQFPSRRRVSYRMCRTNEPSGDTGFFAKRNEKISSPVDICELECASISRFFEFFFENRKLLLRGKGAKAEYTKELWDVMESHMNCDNFSGEYYAEISKKYQCGWVGAPLSSLPLLKHGSGLSRARAEKTLDFVTSHVAPTGFFYTLIEDGIIKDDGFGALSMKNAMLTRKVGDALYFLFKHFEITEPKRAWVESAKKCSDAFVSLYEKYGDFGQFVNVETGEMIFGGTTCGASVCSALAMAYKYFGNEKYLEASKRACEKYYESFVSKGVSYGGPGEALCAPDSESAYAIFEAAVILYEVTGEEKYLTYAKDGLHLFSSWVMSYSYRFPKESEFCRLGINTVGSVFANVQNKHSAPGICTSSGDAIYKLYKYTKNEAYLDLLREIVCFIPQCVSTVSRPIYSWDSPKRKLGAGWISERVNTSDWEGKNNVGEVFFGSSWCESSLLLTFSQII